MDWKMALAVALPIGAVIGIGALWWAERWWKRRFAQQCRVQLDPNLAIGLHAAEARASFDTTVAKLHADAECRLSEFVKEAEEEIRGAVKLGIVSSARVWTHNKEVSRQLAAILRAAKYRVDVCGDYVEIRW